MKILTKYKDGKFLLNHSSMNEAIEKLGKLEIVYEMNKEGKYYEKYEGEIYGNANMLFNNVSVIDLSEDGEAIQIHYSDGFVETLDFKDYKKTWALTREDLEENVDDIR